MEYYTAERKKELLPFTTTWIDLESIILSAVSAGSERQINKTNKQAKDNQK